MIEGDNKTYNIIQDGCGTFGKDYVLDEKGRPVAPNRSSAQSQPKCIEINVGSVEDGEIEHK
tara:strand:+ start:870 stop:1055 length:186 start_codon:yes stop_codon:yes gene_type:complete